MTVSMTDSGGRDLNDLAGSFMLPVVSSHTLTAVPDTEASDIRSMFYSCQRCNHVVMSYTELKSHMTSAHGGSTGTPEVERECPICSKRFRSQSGYKLHVQMHQEDSVIVCRICSKRFQSKAHLVRHMKSHTHLKGYKCSKCGRSYKFKWDLQKHIKICLP